MARKKNFDTWRDEYLHETLVISKKILRPPLHIKLGLMKQFVNALPKDGDCFKYLCRKFPHLSEAKLKEGVFVGPDIRKMMFDSSFEATISTKEKEDWILFKEVVTKFLGNVKASYYELIVVNMIDKFKTLGCLMGLEVHFLLNHLDFFPKNLDDVSEEQGGKISTRHKRDGETIPGTVEYQHDG